MTERGRSVEDIRDAARRNRLAWAERDRRAERVVLAVLVVSLLGAWLAVELAQAIGRWFP